MKIYTRDFGEMDVDENEVLDFKAPILGYEGMQRYVLFKDPEAGEGLLWLQSVEQQNVCFILLDPEEIGLPYYPELPKETLEQLEITGQAAYLLVAVIPEDFHNTTVNLKSPIVVNTDKKIAAQVILDAEYPIRMRLFDAKEGKQC